MKIHRNLQIDQHVWSEETTVMLLHVQQFDGEDIGRPFDLVARHAQWRRLLVFVPPPGSGSKGFERREGSVFQNAKQVQVREPFMEVAGNGRPEKEHTLNVRSACVAHSLHEFVNDLHRNHAILAATNCCLLLHRPNCRHQIRRIRRHLQNRRHRRHSSHRRLRRIRHVHPRCSKTRSKTIGCAEE